MKKKAILLSILSLFILSGCNFVDTIRGWFKKKEPTQEQQNNEDSDPGFIVEPKQVGEFYGGVVIDRYDGYEFSKSKTAIEKPTEGTGVVNIYAFNDFHGAVKENYGEPGLKAFGSFLKEKSQQQNTLILDQGDTWQGSFESNYEYGAIVQDVFNYAGVSLRTVGNHDFDWGLNHLESTSHRKLGDDYIPALAANVFDYANGYEGTTQQSQFGMEYATFILDNGIKVGIVGVIGKDQITSICSNLVSSICFKDHLRKARDISDFLRTEKKCDIVIVSAHESAANLAGHPLTMTSPVSKKPYADLILGGHSHYRQEYTNDGIKCVQWDSNGESAGYIKLNYDFANNCVLQDQTSVNTYDSNYLRSNYGDAEETIEKMVDDYLDITGPIAGEILSSNFTSSFDTTSLANLMSEAIFDAVKTAGYTVDFAVTNYARTGFYDIEFTFGDLYRSFPFDNQIILMDISSQTSNNSLSHNMTYREDTTIKGDSGQHRIAVIDYIGLHQNSDREYDYFPDATNVEIFNPGGGDNPPIYRNILKDYLKNNTEKVFFSNDYSSSNAHFTLD